MNNETKICCICGKSFNGWGNDPWPVVMDDDAECCDDCDMGVVLAARISEMKGAQNGNNF